MSIRANAISLKAARAFSDAIQDRIGLAVAHDQAQPGRCLARGGEAVADQRYPDVHIESGLTRISSS